MPSLYAIATLANCPFLPQQHCLRFSLRLADFHVSTAMDVAISFSNIVVGIGTALRLRRLFRRDQQPVDVIDLASHC